MEEKKYKFLKAEVRGSVSSMFIPQTNKFQGKKPNKERDNKNVVEK